MTMENGEAAGIAPAGGFLFIGELARQTGTDPKTIRFYERAALLAPPRHGRFRTYMSGDVARLRNVLLLRRMGVPIAQIRAMFDEISPDAPVLDQPQAVARLRLHLATLRERHAEVMAQVRQTETALARLAA